jgi:four helix bundle protein
MTDVVATGYERLEVYRRGMRLMREMHRLVSRFPAHERYGLQDQIRRASKSIPANIAEGYAKRASGKEFARALTVSLGSANEMEVHLKIARDLEYIGTSQAREWIDEYVIVGKQLRRLIAYWRTH